MVKFKYIFLSLSHLSVPAPSSEGAVGKVDYVKCILTLVRHTF